MHSLDARMYNLWFTISRLQISNSGNTVQSSLHEYHSTFSVSLNQKQIQHLLLWRDPETNYRLMTEAQQGLKQRTASESMLSCASQGKDPTSQTCCPGVMRDQGRPHPREGLREGTAGGRTLGYKLQLLRNSRTAPQGTHLHWFLFSSLHYTHPSFQFSSAQYFSSISQFTFILEYLRMLIK